ncbi:MAG: Flp family type IVb pilin [Caulobacteraceae bacterium]
MRQTCLYIRRESGATAVEYALIAALIGIVIISGATLVGQAVNNMFVNVDARVITSGAP